jgi:hypothetical protein
VVGVGVGEDIWGVWDGRAGRTILLEGTLSESDAFIGVGSCSSGLRCVHMERESLFIRFRTSLFVRWRTAGRSSITLVAERRSN